MFMNLILISHQQVHLKGGYKVIRPHTLETTASYDDSIKSASCPKEAHKRIMTRIKRNYKNKSIHIPQDCSPERRAELIRKRDYDVNKYKQQLMEDLDKFKADPTVRLERTIYKKGRPHFTYIFEPHEFVVAPDVPLQCYDALPSTGIVHHGYADAKVSSYHVEEMRDLMRCIEEGKVKTLKEYHELRESGKLEELKKEAPKKPSGKGVKAKSKGKKKKGRK